MPLDFFESHNTPMQKITYIDHVKITETINTDLEGTSGDLALELYELEIAIAEAFAAHSKRAVKLDRDLRSLQKKGKAITAEDEQKIDQIAKEAAEIYKKTKEIACEKFPYGDGSERDLKPYLTLKGMKAFKPLLEIKKP